MNAGVPKGKLYMEPYRPEWAAVGQETVETLRRVMKKAIDIRHVGSTAVVGMFSKPLIDIAVGVSNLDDVLEYVDELKELGITDEAEYQKLASNETLIGMYQQGLPKLLENSRMTNGILIQFIGMVLVVAALAYFVIQAMDIKPRAKTRAANPKTAKITGFFLNYALFIILGLILVIVSIIRIDFLSMSNILNILQNASTKGILALGCAGLIVLAGTDLSIGRVLGISAAVTASLVQKSQEPRHMEGTASMGDSTPKRRTWVMMASGP